MRLTRLHRADDAVAPVIGVVLLVAITVILAAVTATFVLALGEGTEAAPSATFAFDPIELSGQPDELRITHESGDAIPNTELYVTGSDGIQDEDGSPKDETRLSWFAMAEDDGASEGETVAAGDSVLVKPPNADPELEDKVFIVTWQSASGDQSTTLARWRGENA